MSDWANAAQGVAEVDDRAVAGSPVYRRIALYSRLLATGSLQMEFARVGARGQTTIPKRVRAAANLNAGDMLAFEVQADHLVVRKMPMAQDDAYLRGLEHTLDEWNSPEDEEAWRDL